MADGRCLHCEAGLILHSDDRHRSLGWEVPCQRSLTPQEEALMWRALIDSSEWTYDIPAVEIPPRL